MTGWEPGRYSKYRKAAVRNLGLVLITFYLNAQAQSEQAHVLTLTAFGPSTKTETKMAAILTETVYQYN